MDFAEVDEVLEVGEDLLEQGDPVVAEVEVVGKDFDGVKEVGQCGLQMGHHFEGLEVVAIGEGFMPVLIKGSELLDESFFCGFCCKRGVKDCLCAGRELSFGALIDLVQLGKVFARFAEVMEGPDPAVLIVRIGAEAMEACFDFVFFKAVFLEDTFSAACDKP